MIAPWMVGVGIFCLVIVATFIVAALCPDCDRPYPMPPPPEYGLEPPPAPPPSPHRFEPEIDAIIALGSRMHEQGATERGEQMIWMLHELAQQRREKEDS